MAAKVNVKFVVGLCIVLMGVFGVAAWIGTKFVYKTAADHEKTALAAEAAGDWELASRNWSRAVNKAQGQTEYIKRWINALSKTTPRPSEAYRDRYRKEYLLAIQALGDANPTDAIGHRAFLDLMLNEAKLMGGTQSGWEAVVQRSESVMRNFAEGDPATATIRRYRGIARTMLMGLTGDQADNLVAQAKEDLLAALQADPTDDEAAATLVDWYRFEAVRTRAKTSVEAGDQIAAEGRAFAAAHLAKRPDAAPVLVADIQMGLADAVRKAPAGSTMGDVFKSAHPQIERLLAAVVRTPAERIDRNVAWQAAQLGLASALPDGAAKGMAGLAHVLQAQPEDVLTRFRMGELDMATRNYTSAMERLQKIVETADIPLSPNGILLFGLREESLARQAECALALWQASRDEKEKADLLAKAKAYRAAYTDLAGPSTARGRLLDGKVRYAEGDRIESRRLLAQYLDEMIPARSDPGALRLLGDILRSEQNLGGAKQQYERIIEINPNDTESLLKLAEIEAALTNFPASARLLEQVLQIEPGNANATRALGQVRDVMAAGSAKDPLTRALGQAQELLFKNPPDLAQALVVIQKAAKELKPEPRTAQALANRLLVMDDRDGAVELLDRAVKENPEHAGLKAMLSQARETDPLKARLDAIEASTFPDVAKAVLVYQTHAAVGNQDEAKKALARAKELEPEHPLVIAALFEQAVAEDKKDEARRLADLAVKHDIDRVKGLIFRVRLELLEGRVREAVGLAQQAVQADPLSPIGYRVLGTTRLAQGRDHFTEALQAFEKGQQLKPDDVECIKGVLKARIGLRQFVEALGIARQNLNLASGDNEFGDIWLALEGQYGDADKAIAFRQKQFERNPKDRQNTLELAALLVRAQRWEQARKPLDAAKAADPRDINVVNFEGHWYCGQNRKDEGNKVWTDYIDATPEAERTLALHVTFAAFLQETGQNQKALDHLLSVRDRQTKGRMEIDREAGDLCFKVGDWAQAAEFYEAALKGADEDPGNVIRYRLIESLVKNSAILTQAGKPADAAAALKRADALCQIDGKDDKPDVSLLLLRADIAMGMGDRERVRPLLDKAVEAAPNSPIAYLKRAQILALQNDMAMINDIKADLNQALRLDPKFAAARQMLAKILFNSQQQDQALTLLKEGVALDPTAMGLRVDNIQMYMALGQTVEAWNMLKEVMAKDPSPDWRVMAAQLYEQVLTDPDKNSGNRTPAPTPMELAVGFYREAWAKRKVPMLAQSLAGAILRLPQPDLAEVKAVLAAPEAGTERDAELLLIRASVAHVEKRTAERDADVVAAFKLLDQTNGDNMLAFTQKIRLMVAGDVPQTVAIFDMIKAAAGPFAETTALQIARTKLTDPKTRAAGLADVDALIASTTDPAALGRALVKCADLLYLERNHEPASDLYLRSSRLLPDDPNLKNNLAYTLTKHLNRHQDALPLAQAAVAAEPANPNFLDTLGTVYLALGNLNKAEETLLAGRDVANTSRTQLPIFLHLVEVHIARGNRAKADEFFAQARRAIGRDSRLEGEFEEEIRRVDRKLKGGR